MYNIPIDVVATFNTVGKIKPNYIRIEDENHVLHTYKVESIAYTKEEKYSGIAAEIFACNIRINDCLKLIQIKYHVESHLWVMLSA